jgi:hypothetical protein
VSSDISAGSPPERPSIQWAPWFPDESDPRTIDAMVTSPAGTLASVRRAGAHPVVGRPERTRQQSIGQQIRTMTHLFSWLRKPGPGYFRYGLRGGDVFFIAAFATAGVVAIALLVAAMPLSAP